VYAAGFELPARYFSPRVEFPHLASILKLSVHPNAQSSNRRKIMIEVGKQAPDFELASHLGGTKFTLGQLKGQKNVMLVFYPLDWTPT
jgi:AhpC/TSA family